MKKIFVAVLLFCSFFAFAETGFDGIAWYTAENAVLRTADCKPMFENEIGALIKDMRGFKILNSEKMFLKAHARLYYFFSSWLLPETVKDDKYRLFGTAYVLTYSSIEEEREFWVNKIQDNTWAGKLIYSDVFNCNLFESSQVFMLINKDMDFNNMNEFEISALMGLTSSVILERFGKRQEKAADTFQISAGTYLADELRKSNDLNTCAFRIYDYNDDTCVCILREMNDYKLSGNRTIIVFFPRKGNL